MAMRSPCYICPLLPHDKNSGVCQTCKSRLAYLKELGIAGDFESPEMEYTHKKPKKKERIEMPEEQQVKGEMKAKQSLLEGLFGDYPEALKSLPDAARIHIRTPMLQVIAYVVEGLKRDGFGAKEEERAA